MGGAFPIEGQAGMHPAAGLVVHQYVHDLRAKARVAVGHFLAWSEGGPALGALSTT